jgi:hypothetical protein
MSCNRCCRHTSRRIIQNRVIDGMVTSPTVLFCILHHSFVVSYMFPFIAPINMDLGTSYTTIKTSFFSAVIKILCTVINLRGSTPALGEFYLVITALTPTTVPPAQSRLPWI